MGNPLEKGQLKNLQLKIKLSSPNPHVIQSQHNRGWQAGKFSRWAGGMLVMLHLGYLWYLYLWQIFQSWNFGAKGWILTDYWCMWPNRPLQLSQAVLMPSYGSRASLSQNEGSHRKSVQSTAYLPSTHAVPLGKETWGLSKGHTTSAWTCSHVGWQRALWMPT